MLGQFMIAFGEVIFDRYNKELRMSNPLFFLKEKEQLVYKLREQKVGLSRNMAFLSSLVVLVGFLLAKRLYRLVSSMISEYQKMRNLKNLDNFYRISRIHTNDFLCTVCADAARNVIFLPCLHLEVCSKCSEKIPDKKCPICRKAIEDVVVVFVS